MTMSSTIILSSLLILGGIWPIKSNPCWISTTLNEYPRKTSCWYIYICIYITSTLSINLNPPQHQPQLPTKKWYFPMFFRIWLFFAFRSWSLGGKPPPKHHQPLLLFSYNWGLRGPVLNQGKTNGLPGVVSVNMYIYIYIYIMTLYMSISILRIWCIHIIIIHPLTRPRLPTAQ